MTTLRDRVRSALGRTTPAEPEARTELDAILARTRPRPSRVYRVASTLALAGVLVAIAIKFRRPNEPRPQPRIDQSSHLYIHVSGEPPESALSFDLASSPSPAGAR